MEQSGDGIRTHDFRNGKPDLYQLSYPRVLVLFSMKPLFHEDGTEVGPNERWAIRKPEKKPERRKVLGDVFYNSLYCLPSKKKDPVISNNVINAVRSISRLRWSKAQPDLIKKELRNIPRGMRIRVMLCLGLNPDGTLKTGGSTG